MRCDGEIHAFLGLHDTCICGDWTLDPPKEEPMATTATAQLFDQHRALADLKARSLQLAEVMRQRDAAVAAALDAVTAALVRDGFMGASERWALAARLTEARELLEPEA